MQRRIANLSATDFLICVRMTDRADGNRANLFVPVLRMSAAERELSPITRLVLQRCTSLFIVVTLVHAGISHAGNVMCVTRLLWINTCGTHMITSLMFGACVITACVCSADIDIQSIALTKWYNNNPPNTINMTSIFELLKHEGSGSRSKLKMLKAYVIYALSTLRPLIATVLCRPGTSWNLSHSRLGAHTTSMSIRRAPILTCTISTSTALYPPECKISAQAALYASCLAFA